MEGEEDGEGGEEELFMRGWWTGEDEAGMYIGKDERGLSFVFPLFLYFSCFPWREQEKK